jgi:hypothetical protein
MGARTVAAADGRTWAVRRNIEWRPPATGDEFEHDVDGGRGAVFLILTALVLFWAVLLAWANSQVHIPWFLRVAAVVVLLFFPARWVARRPWTLVAETSGGYDDERGPEHWVGTVRGRGRATEETRVLIRNLRTRATPGHADSPMRRIS